MTELVAVDSQNSKLEAAGLAWRNTEFGDASWHRLTKVKFSRERHFRLGVIYQETEPCTAADNDLGLVT